MRGDWATDVSIRFIEARDVPFVQEYASDEAISQTSNVPYPYPDGGARQWVDFVIAERLTGTAYAFAVLTGGDFAGVMTLNAVDRQAGSAALDYWIAKPYWNRGISTRAAKQAISFAFETLGLVKLRGICLKRNAASGRVLEKSGFTHVMDFTFETGKFRGETGSRYELTRQSPPASPDSL